jgi:hypothetical protein
LTEGGKKEEIIQQVTEDKIMFNNKTQLLSYNKRSLEIKKKFKKCCIWEC